MEGKIALLLICKAFLGLALMGLVNDFQSQPYMDEIFHIPQAQKYCDGNFSEWDPMITTLPGLYVVSATLLGPIGSVLQLPVSKVCSTFTLRGINLGFMLANVFVLYRLSTTINNKKEEVWAVMDAVSIGVFPVLYFFSFLFYTDPGSVFWVLLMYLACLKKANSMAALSGLAAVLFRQTNIVWVVFMAGLSCEKDIIQWLSCGHKEIQENISNLAVLKYAIKYFFGCLISDRKKVCNLMRKIAQNVYPYVVVVTVFMIFIWVNDGLVVGDKSHHQACLNFPQVYYFLCTCLILGCWHILSLRKVLQCYTYIIQHPFTVSVFVVVSVYLISNFTHVHEYLLADNRHYTFYVWSRIYRKHEMVKFLLIPVYFLAYFTFCMTLNHKTFLWKILFMVCLMVAVVPQKLLEFRYFIIPFCIWRLNIQQSSRWIILFEILMFSIINGITLYMFLFRPFKWANSDHQQRFMW